MTALTLDITNTGEREALSHLADIGCYRMSDGMWTALCDVEAVEAAIVRLTAFARLWRLAEADTGDVDDDMLAELTEYRQYCRECLDDDTRSAERLRTTRDPDWSCSPDIDEGIRQEDERAEQSRQQLAAVDGLLARLGAAVTA